MIDRFVDAQRGLSGQANARDLVIVLDHPAPGGDRGGADDLYGVPGRMCDPVGEDKRDGFLDAHTAGRHTTVLQPLSEPKVRALVFLPCANVGGVALRERGVGKKLMRAIVFERRAHEERFPLCGKHQCPEPLSSAHRQICEIEGGRAAGQYDRAEFQIGHQASGLFDTRLTFVVCDGANLAGH